MTSLPFLSDAELVPLSEAVQEAPTVGVLDSEVGHLPLVAMTVDAQVVGLAGTVTLCQRFRNALPHAIEATYVFPLPARAAVMAFTVTIGERRIEGVLMERGEAREAYDAAIAAGYRAATAEEERPDVFTTRVGNLGPDEEAEVELVIVGPLPCEDGEVEVRLPLVVAPRYVPGRPLAGPGAGEGTASDTDAVPDASRITPPLLVPGGPNPVDLSLSVRIDPAGLRVSGLRSSLHALVEEGDRVEPVAELEGPVTVRLGPGERLDRDFILRFSVADADLAGSAVFTPDPDGDEGTLCVTVLAPPESRRPRDVAVLLDRSGSMDGWKILAARRAAARIVDSLGPTDRFTVIAFDHVVERPTELGESGLTPASDRNRYLAVEFLARLHARGGTEMLPAVQEAIRDLGQSSPDLGRELTCILVTDGQVDNDDQLLRALSTRGAGVRVFTVGIDRAVNAGLLQRLAAVGGGRCDLVESEDRLDQVLSALHRRIGEPPLRDVRVATDRTTMLAGTASPAGHPDCFAGVPLVVWARYQGQPGPVSVTGTDPAGRPFIRRLDAVVRDNPAARPSWARAHVRDLEDSYPAEPPDHKEALASRIVETSLRHGVLCRFTAFVAVDASETTSSSDPQPVMQPVELPSGWAVHDAHIHAAVPRAIPTAERLEAVLLQESGPIMAAPASASIRLVRKMSENRRGVDDGPFEVSLDAFWSRAGDLLAKVDIDDPTGILEELTELLDDLESVGAGAHRVTEALRRLETVLRMPCANVHRQESLNAVRLVLDDSHQPKGRSFWR